MNANASFFMTAEEAAAALGVSVSTLYVYVGRKGIRSEKVPGSKSRRYWREDVERVRDRSGQSAAPPPGLIGSTSITLLTSNGPYYRGLSATALSEDATLEAIAELLWNATGAFDGPLPILPQTYEAACEAVSGLPRSARALALFGLIEHANPRAHDLTSAGFCLAGAGVIRCFAAIVAGAAGPSREPIHLYVAKALGASDGYADLIRRCMVLAADHELDPTTYAVRAAANAGVTPYGAAMAGLVAGRGRRLQKGRSEIVARFVDELLGDDPREAVLFRYRAGEPVPGFGRYAYAERDPRAEALLSALKVQTPASTFEPLATAIALVEDLTGAHPDFILPTVFLGKLLGMRGEELAVTTIGRMVGWIAHALEQFQEHELFRPRAAYVGRLPIVGGPFVDRSGDRAPPRRP